MIDPRIDFDTVEWEQPEPAMRCKTVVRGDARFRLVEFEKGFREPDWCHAGHHGFVLEGEFQIEFAADVVVFRAGDGLFIPPGPSSRHKAMMLSDVVRLMLIEPLFEPEN